MSRYIVAQPDPRTTDPIYLDLAGVKNRLMFQTKEGFKVWVCDLTMKQQSDLLLRGCSLHRFHGGGLSDEINHFFSRQIYKGVDPFSNLFTTI